jgi:ssDNA-binding Zn-finger/Zn-ribbon topoisomerase 1
MGVTCPYCGKVLADYQGRAGHIRFKHPERFREEYGRDPNLPWNPSTSADLTDLLGRIERLEERVEATSRVVRTALGEGGLGFMCPKCGEFSKMEYDEELKLWVCAHCKEKPF